MALPQFAIRNSQFPPVAAVLLSICALILAFVGLFEWDVPLTRFIRSLNDLHMDHLANPWLAQFSNIGDRLGNGESLVILSLVLLAVGHGLKHPQWKDAGRASFIAHGPSAFKANILKKAIRPPPPNFIHSRTPQVSPARASGLDSFPPGP